MVRSRLSTFFIGLTSIMLVSSCGQRQETSTIKFRPFDPNAKNIFMVIGAPNGLSGVATDVREMSKILSDNSTGFNWEVKSNGNAPKDYILRELTANSAAVGPDGTLGLFVSGHGSNDGKFMTANGMMSYTEVANAIALGRSEPLKRLMSFNDSCFSGHWVDGNGSLPDDMKSMSEFPEFFADHSPEEAQALANMQVDTMTQELAAPSLKGRGDRIEQFLTFAASKKTQTSLDYGSSRGGAFTYALRQTFANLRKDNKEATIGDLARTTTQRTWSDTRHHLPVYKAVPAGMLEEKLFEFVQEP
jgi:hypothetical protein